MTNMRRNGGVTKLAVAALAACGLLLSGARPSSGADLEKELVVVATGGVFEQRLKEHFYDPFTRATGVAIRPVAAGSADQWAKLRAMTQVGNVEWDIVSSGDATAEANRDLLAKLDCRAIPNAATQGVFGTCRENRLLRTIGGAVIAYNTKVFPTGKHPRSWADFWDVKRFPGPRSLLGEGTPWWVLAAALMADGVAPDSLVPMDLDRAFRKMDEIKPHVKVWWKTGDQSQQIMRDGEVVLSMMWSGRALGLKAAGVPVEVEWNQAIKDVAYWSVARGAPHPKAAVAFLNFFMARPEAHLAFSRQMNYDTSNRKALELLPEAERLTRATYAPNWERMVGIDGHPWVAENRSRILERWSAWLAR